MHPNPVLPVALSALLSSVGVATSPEASTVPAAAWGPVEEALIRPGARIYPLGTFLDETLAGGLEVEFASWCTLGFLFEDRSAGKAYATTAAHCFGGPEPPLRIPPAVCGLPLALPPCIEDVGDEIYVAGLDGPEGRVVYSPGWDGQHIERDFALIELYPEAVPRANPTMFGWGGPMGVAGPEDTEPLDLVGVYGHGFAFMALDATRKRTGPLTAHTADRWAAAYPNVQGDSGGPVLHRNSGQAVGLVHGILPDNLGPSQPPYTAEGPTILGILAQLHDVPLFRNVELATAQGG